MTDARVSRKTKQLVAERAGFFCEYCWCSEWLSRGSFHVEHIQPRSGGGTNLLSNLCYACAACNGTKSTATEAAESQFQPKVRMYHPRRDRWDQHFQWSDDLSEIIPLTAIGRATVVKLRLNCPNAVDHRRVLRDEGRHRVQALK